MEMQSPKIEEAESVNFLDRFYVQPFVGSGSTYASPVAPKSHSTEAQMFDANGNFKKKTKPAPAPDYDILVELQKSDKVKKKLKRH